MSLVDRGYLILLSREEDSISLNDRREGEFDFLQSLLQPFVEGVWVSICKKCMQLQVAPLTGSPASLCMKDCILM